MIIYSPVQCEDLPRWGRLFHLCQGLPGLLCGVLSRYPKVSIYACGGYLQTLIDPQKYTQGDKNLQITRLCSFFTRNYPPVYVNSGVRYYPFAGIGPTKGPTFAYAAPCRL